MRNRTVLLTPGGIEQMNILKALVFMGDHIARTSRLDIDRVFYSAMMQSGVNRFALVQGEHLYTSPKDFKFTLEVGSRNLPVVMNNFTSLPQSQFLRKRINLCPNAMWSRVFKIVSAPFDASLPPEYKTSSGYSEVRNLLDNIAGMCLAMDRKNSLVDITPVSRWKISRIAKLLPPELVIPTRNLLKQFQPERARLPVPKRSLASEDLKTLIDIFQSDLFLEYASRQSDLETATIARGTVLSKISDKAMELFNKHIDLIELRDSALSILSVTPKIIDTVFGKFPGTLAEELAKRAQALLADQRRLVLYDSNDLFGILMNDRLTRWESAIERGEGRYTKKVR